MKSKIEAAKEMLDTEGMEKIFQKLEKSINELLNMFELISRFIMYYPIDKKNNITLKPFFDGYHLAAVTDREIKHHVVFEIVMDEFLSLSVNCRDFITAVFFLGESFFNMVRGREEVVNLKITGSKSERVELNFGIEKKPFEIDESTDLGWMELKASMFYKLFKDIAKRNGWIVKELPEGVQLDI